MNRKKKKTSLLLNEAGYNDESPIQIIEDTNDHPIQYVNEQAISLLFGKLLLIIYVLVSFLIIGGYIAVIFYFEQYKFIAMIASLSSIVLTSLCSYCGLYKFSKIKDILTIFQENNFYYNKQQTVLKNTTQQLKSETAQYESEIESFQQHLTELEAQYEQWSDIYIKLEEISETEENISDVIDYMNDNLERICDLIKQNHKTYLLNQYYNAAFRDGDKRMNIEEYNRFLGYITSKWKIAFETKGNWKQIFGNKEMINVNDFLPVVEEILEEHHEFIHEEFKAQYNAHKWAHVSARFNESELRMELEEKKDFVLQNMESIQLENKNTIDIELFRKEYSNNCERNHSYLHLIDDRHTNEILQLENENAVQNVSLKKQHKANLSMDDSHTTLLKREYEKIMQRTDRLLEKNKESKKYEKQKKVMDGLRKKCIISLMGYNNKYVCVDSKGKGTCDRERLGEWEKFKCIPIKNGIIALETHFGRYVSVNKHGDIIGDRMWCRDCEEFKVVVGLDGRISLRSIYKRYLSVQSNGSLKFNASKIGEREKFEINMVQREEQKKQWYNFI